MGVLEFFPRMSFLNKYGQIYQITRSHRLEQFSYDDNEVIQQVVCTRVDFRRSANKGGLSMSISTRKLLRRRALRGNFFPIEELFKHVLTLRWDDRNTNGRVGKGCILLIAYNTTAFLTMPDSSGAKFFSVKPPPITNCFIRHYADETPSYSNYHYQGK